MTELQNIYVKQVIAPAAIVDNASFTTNEIDTVVNGVKYNYLTILFSLGATDITMAALKLQSSDTTGASFADLSGFVGGTNFDLPTDTDDDKIWLFQVDLRGKERFFDLVATAGNGSTGTYASCVAILSKAAEVPITATGKGVAAEVIG
jgi:hypothetical protein